MKILVTGANGFIGKNVCSYLLKNSEYKLFGLDLNPQKTFDEVEYIYGDISSDDFVENISGVLKNIDAIVHIAALIDFNNFNNQLISVNAAGTNNILKLAIAAKCRKIIYISSIPVIGTPIDLPITETHAVKPTTLYHITKLMGEHILMQAEKYDISSIVLRISSPIGTDMPKNKILSIFIDKCLKQQNLMINGKGLRRQNYVDVRDISQAIDKSLKTTASGIYNIASNESISNLDLARLCIKTTSSQSIIEFSGEIDKEEDANWDISIEKAECELGYSPKYSIEDSIAEITGNS